MIHIAAWIVSIVGVYCSSHCAQQSERPPSPDWAATAAVNQKWDHLHHQPPQWHLLPFITSAAVDKAEVSY